MEFWAPLAVLLGAGLTALVNWLINNRKSSGKIKTSEASDLWAESQAIRKELREERQALKEEIAALRKEVRDCHGESNQLKERLAALEGRGRGVN